MPIATIIALFAAGLAVLAMGTPLGAIFLVAGVIALSLKLGMPVVGDDRSRRDKGAQLRGNRGKTQPF